MSIDATTIAAYQSGAFGVRDFVVVRGKDGDGAAKVFAWWTGEDDVEGNVTALDGSVASLVFVGGCGLVVPEIVSAIGIDTRTVSVELSHIHAGVQDMVRGGYIRLAPVEIHRAVFDAATGAPTSDPYPRFHGVVDSIELPTAAEGQEAALTLACTTTPIHLTRTNPAMVSDEQQRLRSDDRFFQYSDTAGQIEIWWGQAKGNS